MKRRCLYLHIGYPTVERERAILLARVPDLDEVMAHRIAEVVAAIREAGMRKPPSVSESLDWARALLALGLDVGAESTIDTLNVLLKHRTDIDKAARHFGSVDKR